MARLSISVNTAGLTRSAPLSSKEVGLIAERSAIPMLNVSKWLDDPLITNTFVLSADLGALHMRQLIMCAASDTTYHDSSHRNWHVC